MPGWGAGDRLRGKGAGMTLAQILQGCLQCTWHQWAPKNFTAQELLPLSGLGQTGTKPEQQDQGSRPGPAVAFPQ